MSAVRKVHEMFSSYLVVNEEFELVLGVLQLQQALEEHRDKGGGLLDEDADQHHRVLAFLLETNH